MFKGRYIATVVVLACLGGVVFYSSQHRPEKPSVLSSYRQKVDFPLYYPVNLPGEFSVDESSVSSGDGVILYQVTHSSGEKINISLQQKPADFDYENFYRETLKSPQSYLLPIGKVTFGKINRGGLVSIETEKTWILINTVSPIEYDQLKPLIARLKQVN
jgi:hypothetical protein